MRPRFGLPAATLVAITAVMTAAVAIAAGPRNHATIDATPSPAPTGTQAVIDGRITGPKAAGAIVRLFDASLGVFLGPPVTTTADGAYEFSGFETEVFTNTAWRVKAQTTKGREFWSARVYQRVAASLTLKAYTSSGIETQSGYTGHALTFEGAIKPAALGAGGPVIHRRELVFLQELVNSASGWRNVGEASIDSDSQFKMRYTFGIPGLHEMRAMFPGDAQNVAGASVAVPIGIAQRQVATFGISVTKNYLVDGDSAVISGSDEGAVPGVTEMTLFGREFEQDFAPVVGVPPVSAGPDGSYSFSVHPDYNTVYQVRASGASTAWLHLDVAPSVVVIDAPASATVGSAVTITGTVLPLDEAGRPIELEVLGPDGVYRSVCPGLPSPPPGSASSCLTNPGTISTTLTYRLSWTPRTTGTATLRVLVPGDHRNVAGSASITLCVLASQRRSRGKMMSGC